jgi:hypothetical protein
LSLAQWTQETGKHEGGQGRPDDDDRASEAGKNSRPQQGREAGTTRFGMEDGDNTDIPATGGPGSDEAPSDRSS